LPEATRFSLTLFDVQIIYRQLQYFTNNIDTVFQEIFMLLFGHFEAAFIFCQVYFIVVDLNTEWKFGKVVIIYTITGNALAARQFGIFFNAVDRHFRRTTEHRKHGPILEEVDRVVAPLAGGHHAAVEAKDAVQFAPVEGDLVGGGRRRAGAPVNLARVRFAKRHAAPPWLSSGFHDRARIQ